jgi:hypothetical protein
MSDEQLSNGQTIKHGPHNASYVSASFVVAPPHHSHYETNASLLRQAPQRQDDSLTCNRYFLEEFESLNTHFIETHKLSYVQETTGKKGFYQSKVYE